MIKNKLDFKLINFAIIMFIIFLMYQTGNIWINIFFKLISIFSPLFIAFVIAYAVYPLLEFFTNHKIPKTIGILIICLLLFGMVAFLGIKIFPMLFVQLSNLFNGIMTFVKNISNNYDLDMGALQSSLSDIFNDILVSLGKYVSDGAVNIIGISIQYLTLAFIVFSLTIYFLADMEKIRLNLKVYLKRNSKKVYNYIELLDREMKNYLGGFVKIMIIALFEYTFAYLIIGHPDAMLLGFLALLSNLVPYFGGMITNVVAAITAAVISPALLIRTIITFVVLSAVDGYLINPLVYGKSNQVPPLVVIMSVFAGGILFGIFGIVASLPLAIIIITTYKYFRVDISNKIEDIKERKEES